MAQASMVQAQASALRSSFWVLGTDVQIPPVFYRTSYPFGAKALLTLKAWGAWASSWGEWASPWGDWASPWGDWASPLEA